MNWHLTAQAPPGNFIGRLPTMRMAARLPAVSQAIIAWSPLWSKSGEECTHFYDSFIQHRAISHGSLTLIHPTSRSGKYPRTDVSLYSIIERLRRGERWWAAELALRAAGLGMLAFCALMARTVYRLANLPPPHDGTSLEFILGAIAVVSLWTGLALLFEGPGLFRLMPKPPRAMF